MSFPASPLNGDRHIKGSRIYQYDSTTNSWLLIEDGEFVGIVATVTTDVSLTGNVKTLFADGSSGTVAIDLPPTPKTGAEITIKATNIDNEVKINSVSIEGVTADYVFSSPGDTLVLQYDGTTWQIMNEINALYPNPRDPSHTVYEDMSQSLIGRQLSSTAGKVDYNWGNNSITMESGGDMTVANDRLLWNQQMPHGSKLNSSIYPHIHWEQVNSNQIEWRLAYRIQKNGQAKSTTWTEITCDSVNDSAYVYSSGTLNQITGFPAIDMTGAGISATIQFRLVREDVTAGDIEVTFVDCHVELDSDGSREQYVK